MIALLLFAGPAASAALLAATAPLARAAAVRVAWWWAERAARPAENVADLHGALVLAELNAWLRPEREYAAVQHQHLVVAR